MKGTVESWLGRNLVAVIAAVLVFAGLVLLAATLAPELTDAAKAAFMFVLSGALAAGGFFAARRRKNGFTMALLGCGASSLFISIMVTHLVFGLFGIVSAYALLLAWMIGCLAVSRVISSVLLRIVVQLGLAASLVLGYGSEVDGERLALLVGYQLAATVVLVGGNMRVVRGMYCETLASALALSVLGGCFICGAVGTSDGMGLDTGWAGVALLVQLAQSTALAVLLAASAAKDPEQLAAENGTRNLSPAARTLLMIAAAGLWICTVRIDAVSAVRFFLASSGFSLSGVAVVDASMGLAAILMAAAAIGAACAVRTWQDNSSGAPFRTLLFTLVLGGAITCVDRFMAVLIAQIGDAHVVVGWLAVWAVVPLVLARVTGDAFHNRAAFAFVPCAMVSICLETMPGCSTVIGGVSGILACVGCALAICALCAAIVSALQHERPDVPGADSRRVLMVLLLLCCEAAVLAVPAQPGLPFAGAIACPLAACGLAMLRFVAPRLFGASFDNLVFANELAVMLLCVPFVLAAPDDAVASALFGIFTAACVALLVTRFTEEPARPLVSAALSTPGPQSASGQSARLVIGGAMLMILVLAYAASCTPFAQEGFQASVICMGCGLLCVFAGFLKNVRALHLFGLVVALASVAKLVLVDVESASSLAHVGAYIGGGLVCFAISAVYNHALRRRTPCPGE